MGIKRNIGGSWTTGCLPYRNIAGVWTPIKNVWRNIAGVWTQVFVTHQFSGVTNGSNGNRNVAVAGQSFKGRAVSGINYSLSNNLVTITFPVTGLGPDFFTNVTLSGDNFGYDEETYWAKDASYLADDGFGNSRYAWNSAGGIAAVGNSTTVVFRG